MLNGLNDTTEFTMNYFVQLTISIQREKPKIYEKT